jgi:hypothetical protein
MRATEVLQKSLPARTQSLDRWGLVVLVRVFDDAASWLQLPKWSDDEMSAVLNLKSLIDRGMGDLVEKYSLSIIKVGEQDVIIKASKFAIRVLADRDGLSMVYFDTEHRPIKGFNIFLFLVNKRREFLTFSSSKFDLGTYSDFIENELISLVRHIENAGTDILEGSKDWISAYSWPSVNAPEYLTDLMI